MEKEIVTIVGSLNYDIILMQKRLPVLGETFSADGINFSCGGKGANQAVQCSKLGLETYMIGKVGNDGYGKELRNNLSQYGINLDYLFVGDTNTGLGIVNSVEDGSVSSTIYKGANYSISISEIEEAAEIIKKSNIVILQLEIPRDVVEYTIKLARDNNCYIILNAAPAINIGAEYLRMVDCLVVNESEASFYSGKDIKTKEDANDACGELFQLVRQLVVITLGEKGSLIFDGNRKYFFNSLKVNVVETTGAGDSYIGAIAYSILKNKTYEEMGNFSTKVSSKTVMRIGAQEAMPTIEEVRNEF